MNTLPADLFGGSACFMNSPNCTNNDIDALEIQIIEIVLYLNTNLHSIVFSSLAQIHDLSC